MIVYAGFDLHRHAFFVGALPDDMRFDPEEFDAL